MRAIAEGVAAIRDGRAEVPRQVRDTVLSIAVSPVSRDGTRKARPSAHAQPLVRVPSSAHPRTNHVLTTPVPLPSRWPRPRVVRKRGDRTCEAIRHARADRSRHS